MASNPFPQWLEEVVADKIVIDLDDVNAEANGNLWRFSLTPEQAAAITPGQVETFASEVVAARSQQLTALGSGSMLFYCWNDKMTAQLRFSLVSTSHEILPFSGPIERVADLSSIVRAFLRLPYHAGIPWSEFKDVTHLSQTDLEQLDEPSAQSMPPLKVWTQKLPL